MECQTPQEVVVGTEAAYEELMQTPQEDPTDGSAGKEHAETAPTPNEDSTQSSVGQHPVEAEKEVVASLGQEGSEQMEASEKEHLVDTHNEDSAVHVRERTEEVPTTEADNEVCPPDELDERFAAACKNPR